MPKVKSSENTAKDTETPKPPQGQRNIDNTPSEDLASLLNEQYNLLIQCQNNIRNINTVLDNRKKQRLIDEQKIKE
jgi:ribonuclease HIII